jgi:tRNA dimethylallyltransferase
MRGLPVKVTPSAPADGLSTYPLTPAHSPLIAVLGPTGSGKSDLAVTLAEELNGEIVNFDSVQVCRGLDIGSAKPPLSARKGIPHHLIDCVDPNEGLTAGAYARMAGPILEEIHHRGSIPVLVGGTGFYLRAVLDGLSPAPVGNQSLRERLGSLARRRPGALHRYLARRDPLSGQRIHPNDHQKLIRAIELGLLSNRPASETQRLPRQRLHGLEAFKIGLRPDRTSLYKRLNDRTAQMFRGGLLEETEALLNSGVSRESKGMQSLGYRQAVKVLLDGMGLDEAIAECQTKTRQYAKRQMTWFRKESNVVWLSGFGYEPEIQRAALSRVQIFLVESTPCV